MKKTETKNTNKKNEELKKKNSDQKDLENNKPKETNLLKEPKKNHKKKIREINTDACVNIALDTISNKRQIIIFVNTKRGAESQAEKISKKLFSNEKLNALSEKILRVLPTPTKQCKRLSECIKKGTAFHHAGLHHKQRDLIEESFKEKIIKVICATPTLAAGVNLPAFRVIIRDLKRYGGLWGMTNIPVLEYEQQAGRAGRPGKDPWGEAICIAKTETEKKQIKENYVEGKSEEITSKLAVEPVLRTYFLSLVAGEFINSIEELKEFFSKTFYAHEYGDLEKLFQKLEGINKELIKWGFIEEKPTKTDKKQTDKKQEENTQKEKENTQKENKKTVLKENQKKELGADFINADKLLSKEKISKTKTKNKEIIKLTATKIGKRVSELYLDPYTANHIIKGLKRCKTKMMTSFGLIHLCVSTIELKPQLTVKQAEYDLVEKTVAENETNFLTLLPPIYTEEYDEFLKTIKTTNLFMAWINEEGEEEIMEKFGVRPGELHAKKERIDWLIYSAEEIARTLYMKKEQNYLRKLRIRIKQGAKEELMPLLKLKGIGRIRARKIYKKGIKNVSGIKQINPTTLTEIVGKKIAIQLKEQVGITIDEKKLEVKENKRKGQISLKDWT